MILKVLMSCKKYGWGRGVSVGCCLVRVGSEDLYTMSLPL